MIYILAIIFSVIFFIIIVNLVRNNKLDEKYAIIWIVFAFSVIILSLFPKLIELAQFLGIYYSPILLLLLSIIFIIFFIVHITLALTKQNKMIVKLTQELSIAQNEIKKLNNRSKKNNNK